MDASMIICLRDMRIQELSFQVCYAVQCLAKSSLFACIVITRKMVKTIHTDFYAVLLG